MLFFSESQSTQDEVNTVISTITTTKLLQNEMSNMLGEEIRRKNASQLILKTGNLQLEGKMDK
jgi:hypothetical protein